MRRAVLVVALVMLAFPPATAQDDEAWALERAETAPAGSAPTWAQTVGTTLTFTEKYFDAEGTARGELQATWQVARTEGGQVVWEVRSDGENTDDGTWVVREADRAIVSAPSQDLVGRGFHVYLVNVRPGDVVDIRGNAYTVVAGEDAQTLGAVAQGNGVVSQMIFSTDSGILLGWQISKDGVVRVTTVLTAAQGGQAGAGDFDVRTLLGIVTVFEFILFAAIYKLYRRKLERNLAAPARAFCTSCGSTLAAPGVACRSCGGPQGVGA